MFVVFCYIWLPFMIIPVYAALERIPDSLIEASQDLGARTWRTTLRTVVLPLALPGIVAGSIFTFSLTLGDFITPLLIGGTNSNLIGNVIYDNIGIANNLPFAAALAHRADRDHDALPARRAGARRVRGDVTWRPPARVVLGSGSSGAAFLFIPIVPIVIFASTARTSQSWPIPDFTTHWFCVAWHDEQVRNAFLCCRSRSGWSATALALLLGSRRGVRAVPVQVLRPGGDLVPAGAAARAARHHHRDRAELVLQFNGLQLARSRSSSGTPRSASW